MAAPVPNFVCRRVPRALLLPFALACVLLTGCEPEDVTHSRQVESLKNDLEETKRKLTHAQKSLAMKDDELLLATTNFESAKASLAEKEQALAERDAQLGKVRAEIDALKKRDAFVFSEIRTLQQQGQTALALSRYQKFIAEYPKSPLISAVSSAINELTSPGMTSSGSLTPGIRPPTETPDPKRREREFVKTFNEGYMTLAEIAPFLKKKSLQQVLALLGPPNKAFNDSTELGYEEKAINPATGRRGMLIIGFDAGTVTSLRVEYTGRKITP